MDSHCDFPIELLSKDNERFQTNGCVLAKVSTVMKPWIEDQRQLHSRHTVANELPCFPLHTINARTLAIVLQFVECHHQTPMNPLENKRLSNRSMLLETVGHTFAAMVDDLTATELVALANAANFLDIHPLLHLVCAKMATILLQQDSRGIVRTLGVSESVIPPFPVIDNKH